MEISKGDFLLVWIFSSLKYCFFPLRCWLFLEISNGIDIVFSFVHNETAHLKVSRRSERLVWNHGHARLFHKKIKEVNVHLEDNLGGHAFFHLMILCCCPRQIWAILWILFHENVFMCGILWKWKLLSHVPTLCNHMDCGAWNSPGQNTGVNSLSLLQAIFSPRDQT